MNEWSIRRKRIILIIIIAALVVLVGIPLFFLGYRAPTCLDGRQNGDESGVDCGGSCERLCTAESLPIITQGDPRLLEIAPGFFEAVALVENPNVSAEVLRARYTFKIYGVDSSVPIRTIVGETFVPKNEEFVVFEGPFELGDLEPARLTFEWDESTLVWQKDIEPEADLSIRNTVLSAEGPQPRIDSTVVNNSLERVENIELVALVEDASGSIMAASKTFVELLQRGESLPIVFSWPRAFSSEAGNVRVLYRTFPDRSYLR